MFEKIYDVNNLYHSVKRVCKSSGWKYATQSYSENCLFKLRELSEKLKNKTYRPGIPFVFLFNERGKTRFIESQNVEDRVVQECLCKYILMPQVMKHIIYDNSSSVKGRGTEFFNERLKKRLIKWRRIRGNSGYIIIGDFTKYFDNIDHHQFLSNLKDFDIDDETLDFISLFLAQHRVDSQYYNKPYDAVNAAHNKDNDKKVSKSIGIGSQLAQIAGIIGAYKVDNYVTKVCGNGNYARYMDDFYCLCKTKEEAEKILTGIKIICNTNKLLLNLRKTQIVKLTREFTILKRVYKLKPNYLYIKLHNDSYKRERRKINTLSEEVVKEQYKSWRGSIVKEFGVTRKLMNLDELFSKRIK